MCYLIKDNNVITLKKAKHCKYREYKLDKIK